MKETQPKASVAKTNVDVHRVESVEIRIEEYPNSGFDVLEFWVNAELANQLVLKCFCDHRGFNVRQINDSIIERIIEVKK